MENASSFLHLLDTKRCFTAFGAPHFAARLWLRTFLCRFKNFYKNKTFLDLTVSYKCKTQEVKSLDSVTRFFVALVNAIFRHTPYDQQVAQRILKKVENTQEKERNDYE